MHISKLLSGVAVGALAFSLGVPAANADHKPIPDMIYADFPNQHPLSLGWFTRFSGYLRRTDLMMLIGSQMPDAGHYVLTGPPPERLR